MQNNEVFKSETAPVPVDVRNERIKSTTDGYVNQNINQSSSIRFGIWDIPARLKSKIYHTVNHTYEIIATSEINRLTQLCEIERTKHLTTSSFAQTNPFLEGQPITGNRNKLVQIEGAWLWLFECQQYLLPLHTQKENCFDKKPNLLSGYSLLHRPYSSSNIFICFRKYMRW